MRILVMSADPAAREQMAVSVRSAQRRMGEEIEVIEAADGIAAMALARRHQPDVLVLDEITSRAGAFAVAQDLKAADPPFPGALIILLEREQDAWLAAWSGADAWFVKPADPFKVAETVERLVGAPAKEAV